MTGEDASGARRPLRWAIGCTVLVAALGVTISRPPQPRLLWNSSESAPVGLWLVRPDASVRRGDMVIARLAPQWRALAAQRRYLPSNIPLIKRVAAVAEDKICAVGDRIEINGRSVATRLERDKAGRAMPFWRDCLVLRPGFVLLLMDHPASFDGRYFGPTQRTELIGKAELLWAR